MSAVAATPPPGTLLDPSAERVGPRSLVGHSLTITRRNLLQVRGNPQLLVFIAVQPILFVLLFVYVFGGAISGSTRDYVQFVIPGIIVQTVVFGTVMTGIGLNEDLAKGIIDRFRSLPIARSAVLTGRILADGARTAAATLVTVAVGALLGFRLQAGPVAALGALALAVGFGSAFAWIAATVGLTVRNPETAQSAGFLWMVPLTFASAAFAPAASMPGWLRPFVEANPVTVLTEALRALTVGGPAAGPVLKSVAWIIGLTVVFATLAIRQYRRLG
jgi:oleandomycin transport system permease protein